MDNQLLNTLLYSVIAAAATIAGLYMLLAGKEWALKNSIYFVSFSAGVLLTAAFLHLLPEAIEANPQALSIVLVTLLVFYMLEHALAVHACREHGCEVHEVGTMAFIGIGLHSLIDGVAIGAGFEADFSVGLAAALGVLLHKLPVGIALTALLIHSDYDRSRTVIVVWIVALLTVVGGLGAQLFLNDIEYSTLGVFLAVSAGSFVYVGASDLLPETHKDLRLSNIVLVLGGAFLIYFIARIMGV